MSIYALKTNTQVNHELLPRDEVTILDHRLSNFAGTIPEFLVYLHGFVKDNPMHIDTGLFDYTYEGVTVTPVETDHQELVDEVTAMLRLLPTVYVRIGMLSVVNREPLGRFEDHKELREHEHQLKWLRRITVDLIVREITRPLDTANIQLTDAVANLRARLDECKNNRFVKQAVDEKWIKPLYWDPLDCCGYNYETIETDEPVTEVTPRTFYIDLVALYLSHDEKLAIMKEARDLDVPVTWHPLGMQLHYINASHN